MNPDADALFRKFVSKAKFRDIVLLIRLYELGNMKRAAEALGMSQPAVSLAVAELERLLGAELFLRHARGVDPTQVTKELLPVARRIVAAIGDGADIVTGILNDSAGFVRVSATPAAISALLHPVIRTFARKFPKVHIEITEINAAHTLHAASDGACDILCERQPDVTPEGWQFETCIPDALVVICGRGNPLASRGTATLAQLRGFKWLPTRRGSVARERFERLAAEMELPPENRSGIVTHVSMLTLELLAKDDYLTLVPRSVAVPWLRGGLAVELKTPATTPLQSLGLLWRSDGAHQATRMLVQELRAHFRPAAPPPGGA